MAIHTGYGSTGPPAPPRMKPRVVSAAQRTSCVRCEGRAPRARGPAPACAAHSGLLPPSLPRRARSPDAPAPPPESGSRGEERGRAVRRHGTHCEVTRARDGVVVQGSFGRAGAGLAALSALALCTVGLLGFYSSK